MPNAPSGVGRALFDRYVFARFSKVHRPPSPKAAYLGSGGRLDQNSHAACRGPSNPRPELPGHHSLLADG